MATVEQSVPTLPTETAIDIRNFNLFYGSFQALDGISMSISAKRITALIGASGCGKSTLLRAMNRMHDNTPGTHGADLQSSARRAHRSVHLGQVRLTSTGLANRA
jgi:ABC-type phosphate transport system ATPase subunit